MCDTITPFDFRKIINFHKVNRPIATLRISKDVNPAFSAQVIFKEDLINKIVEKPKCLLSEYIASTPTIVETRSFDSFNKIKPISGGEYHLATCLQYLINKKEEVRMMVLDTWRINVNTFDDIRRAEKLIPKYPDHWE